MRFARGVAFIVCSAGCGNVNSTASPDVAPPDAMEASDADSTPVDGSLPSGVAIQVSSTGDDANDGLTKPVKTIKRALGLAVAVPGVTSVALAGGRYSAESGEAFPYTVPSGLIIAGPAGGGAILAGAKQELGLIVADGSLRDIEFEDFTTAITVRGSVSLDGLRFRTSITAVRGESSAKLTVHNLDVVGDPGACATGIEMTGSAQLTASGVTSRALKSTLSARDQSVVKLDHATIMADGSCMDFSAGAVTVATSKTVTVDDSSIDGGLHGLFVIGTQVVQPQVTLSNTTIRNTKRIAISADRTKLYMSGGMISNGEVGIEIYAGSLVGLSGVALSDNRAGSIEVGAASLSMRSCSIRNSGSIYIYGAATLDFGTAASPGNNVFLSGTSVDIDAGSRGLHPTAVGNTWRPNVQGSDAAGHYAATVITGPVGYNGSTNFNISSESTLQL